MEKQCKKKKYLLETSEIVERWKEYYEEASGGKFQYNAKHNAYQFVTNDSLEDILKNYQTISFSKYDIEFVWTNDSQYCFGQVIKIKVI